MAKASPIQLSFNAGEIAPEAASRLDVAKYQSGCTRMENIIPLVQGPARRRGGTRYVAEVKDSTKRTWLIRFQFSASQVYVLEIGDQYLRFFTDRAKLMASGAAWVTATAYTVGDIVTQFGNAYYCKTAHTSGATLAGDIAYWYQMPAGGEYEIPAPWAVADLTNSDGSFALDMQQSGDIIYVVHPNYPPYKISRYAATRWIITALDVDGGPFDDVDPDQTVTVVASARTGSVTITASAATFAATDIGRLFYIEQTKANSITAWQVGVVFGGTGQRRRSGGKTYINLSTGTTGTATPVHSSGSESDGGVAWQFEDAGYGWAKITGFTSATQVTATVLSDIPEQATGANVTTRWAFGSWGSVPGYPSHCFFFRNRLGFMRARDRKLWFSVAADYETFTTKDDSGRVVADMAITRTLESDEANTIQWVVADESLVIGTAGGEHVCDAMTDSEAFGPENVVITKASEYGSRSVKPVRAGSSMLFVQRSGRKLRELSVEDVSGKYRSTDMNVLAPHMVPKGEAITQIAYQKEPYSIVWVMLSGGGLRGFTFNREQYQEPPYGGWHRHNIGGAGIVEAVMSAPSPTNDRDDVWLIVRRTVNGVSRRYIEVMRPEYETGDAQEDAFYVDCGLTYDGAPATVISGLWHLEGKVVDVLVDGGAHPQRTVSSGQITLQAPASVVHVGLPCPAKLATLRLEAGAADGTAQGKTKRVNRITVRFLETLGGKLGPTEAKLDAIRFRSVEDPMDAAPPLFSGDKEMVWPGGYEHDGIIWYVQDQPLPATVTAFMPQVTTQDR